MLTIKLQTPKIIKIFGFVGPAISCKCNNCKAPSISNENINATINVIIVNIPSNSVRTQPNVFLTVIWLEICSEKREGKKSENKNNKKWLTGKQKWWSKTNKLQIPYNKRPIILHWMN